MPFYDPSASAGADEIKQPSLSELWRYLALQGIHRAAMAAGTPRDLGVLGAQGVQASENMLSRVIGRPQDTRDLSQSRGFINFPTTAEAERWSLNRLGRYLPADTGWKPPIDRGITAPTDDRGVLSVGNN
jgi:hypothetical protein